MRYYEFRTLLEYDRKKTAQQRGSGLLNAIEKDKDFYIQIQRIEPEQQINAVLEKLEEMDPTQNNKFVLWLVKQYNNQQFKIKDASRVNQVLSHFIDRDVKRHFNRHGLLPDINRYDYESLDQKIEQITGPSIESPTNIKQVKYKYAHQMRVLYSGDLGQLIVPLSMDASCELGSESWCTAYTDKEKNAYKGYNKDGYLYVWIEPDGSKYQFHFERTEFRDENNASISPEKISYFRKHEITKQLFFLKEKQIIDKEDPWQTYMYAHRVLGKRWDGPHADAAEATIASEPLWAYSYASLILGERWDKPHDDAAEKSIASIPDLAFGYAYYVLKKKWDGPHAKTAEENIMNSKYADDYQRMPEDNT